MAIGSARGSIFLDVANARANVRALGGDLRAFGSQASSGFSGVADSIVRNEQHINALGRSLTIGGAAMTAFFGTGLKTAADFEVMMNRVMALSGATNEQFEELKSLALDLSQTTRYTANEIADAMGFLAMAGFEVNDIMAALPGTLNLAAAAQMDLGRAADLSTNILTSFGMEAENLDSVVDMLVMTFTNSNTSMEQLGDAFKYVGPVAMAAGLEFEEVAAALGMLGDAGIQGSMAGTTLRGAITRLISPTAKTQKILDEFGVTVTDASGQMLPMADILSQFPPVSQEAADAMAALGSAAEAAGYDIDAAQDSGKSWEQILADLEAQGVDTTSILGDLGADAETVGKIMEVFGLRAGPGMVSLLTQGTDKLSEFTDQIADSGGVAQHVADTQLRGLTGSLNLLRAAWQSLMIRAMDSGPIQAIAGFVRMLTAMVSAIGKLPSPILGVLAAVVGLSGVMLTLGGVFLLLLPRIARTYQAVMAFQKWGGVSRAVTVLSGSLGGMRREMMLMPGPIGRVSTSIANMFSTMRADGPLRTLRGSLMNFVRMHPLLVGMGLVAGAVGLAYKTNFLGIGDAIDGLVGRVRGIADDMRAAFRGSGDAAAIAADQVAQFAEATHVADGKTVYTAFRTNADGEREKVGEIVESYKNADGTTAQVLIRGDDGEYWATIDLATGEISNAEIEVGANTQPFHERVNASLGVLEQAFRDAGIGWAADIVSNLQGVVSFIAGMAATIRGFFSDVGSILSSLGLGEFAGFFSQLATQIGTALVVLAPLGAGLKLIFSTLSILKPILSIITVLFKALGIAVAVLTSPIGLVVAAVAALAAGAVYAYKNFEPFRNVVDRAAKALRDFARNQVVRFLRDMGRQFRDVVDRVTDFVRNINDVLRPMDRLRSVASTVGAFLVSAFTAGRNSVGTFLSIIQPIIDHFRNIMDLASDLGRVLAAVFQRDWSGAWDALKDAAESAIDFIISGFTALPRTIINLITSVNWGGVFDGIMDAADAAIGWVLDAIRGIDWGALIQGGWNVIRDGISAAWDAITSLNWRDFIPDFGAWADWITHKLGDLAAWGIGKFGGWASWITHKLSDLASWGIGKFGGWGTWITHKLASASRWGIGAFGNWASWITHKLADFGSWGIETFSGWGTWISEIEWPDWLTGFVDWLVEKMPTIDWPSASEILQAIVDWLNQFNPLTGGPSQEEQQRGAGQTAQARRNAGGGAQGGNWSLPGTVNMNLPFGDINFELTGGQPAPPALMADIENLRSSLQSLVDYNDESWAHIAGTTLAESARARGGATSEFTTMAGTIPGHTANLRSRVQSDFQALQGAVSSNSATARSQASSNFATMQGDTTRSASTIRSRVVSDFNSLQRSVTSSASTTRSTTSSEMSSMNTAVIGHISGMQANAAVQMALMATTADTQGSATSTALTGWMTGANVRLIAGMAIMVSTIRDQGAAMESAGLYAGDMAGRGVANGLWRQLPRVREAAAAIIREVDSTMRRVGQMRSPSRLTTRLGEMLGMGPVVGLLSKVRDVRDAASRLVHAAAPDVPQREWDLALGRTPVGVGAGTTIIEHHYHESNAYILDSKEWAAAQDGIAKGRAAYRHLSTPQAPASRRGRR